jgi:hypothetical protein
VRTKLFTGMMTTYGYALLGAAAWDPLAKGEPFDLRNLMAVVIGFAMHGFALYISPRGES